MANISLIDLSVNFSNKTAVEHDFYAHYYYAYVHHAAALTAAFMNIICGIVFFQKELLMSGPFFQFSLLNSFGAATGMIILSGYSFTRCGPLCSQAYKYPTQMFELYGIMYFCNALYFGGSLVQIAVSFQLYFSITQRFKRLNSLPPINVMNVFTLISFSLALSLIFSFKVTEIRYLTVLNGTAHWEVAYQVLLDQSNRYLVALSIFFVVISNKIFLVVLIITNILLYVELRKIMLRKMRLTNSNASMIAYERSLIATRLHSNPNINITSIEILSQASLKVKKPDGGEESKRKTLIMVLWVSVVFSSSRLVFAIANLFLLLMQNSVWHWWSGAFNYFYTCLVYISYFFVYMRTNKLFRKKFYKIFLRRDIK